MNNESPAKLFLNAHFKYYKKHCDTVCIRDPYSSSCIHNANWQKCQH